MAVYNYCQLCKRDSDLKLKKCQHCQTPFPTQDKKYRVRVKYRGHTVTRMTHALTVAREIESAIKGDLARGKFDIYVKKKVLTLDELFEKYLSWAKQNKKSWADDENRYQQYAKDFFGSKRLDQIKPFDIERFKNQLKKTESRRGGTLSEATVKHHIIVIRRLYNMARKWGLYKGENPVDRVTMPKVDNTRIRYLSDSERARLLDAIEKIRIADYDAADIVLFALLSGFRRGEILKLQWQHVNFETGFITLFAPKGGKTVDVPVSEQALNLLNMRDRINEYVFPGKDGIGRRADFNGPWRRVRKLAELNDFRFHDLRHNFASQLVSSGVDLPVIKELLTHKDIQTTMKYAHLAPGALKKAAAASGELLMNGTGADVIGINKGAGS